jgi:Tfp pilus assembly protein PilW
MGSTTFSGPVTSEAGFVSGAGYISGTGAVGTSVTAATLAVTSAMNGMTIPVNRAAGTAITLPAATGSQAVYRFIVGTSVTSNATTIKVANATDVMNGTAAVSGTTAAVFGTLPASDTVDMNGSTKGGLAGSYVEVIDYAEGYWLVTAALVGSGTPATPFAATV